MSKANKKKKYRVRYDRVVIVVLALVILAVLITSCTKAIFGDNEPETSNSGISTIENQTSESSAPNDDMSDVTAENTEPSSEESASQQEINGNYKTEVHSYDDIYKGSLVLVNNDYEYKFLENDIEAVTLYDNKNDYYGAGDYVTKIDRAALYQLNSMMEAYAQSQNITSTGIFILDGYRTYEEQVERHASGKSRTFEAGHTDYHTGRTFDVFYNDNESNTGYSYFSASGNYEWFAENAANYGFIVRFPEGKDDITGEKARAYTYRYVDIPHAVYMNNNNICMEEYISELKSHNIDNPLAISANGRNYSVYYVPAEKNDTNEILVPTDKIYTVSGNNIDGYIVTVTE